MTNSNKQLNYLNELGKRIKTERMSKGQNQKQCAIIGEVSAPTQSLYENGERAPNAEYFFNLHNNNYDVQKILIGEPKNNGISTPNLSSNTFDKDIFMLINDTNGLEDKAINLDKRADLFIHLQNLLQSFNVGEINKGSVKGIIELID